MFAKILIANRGEIACRIIKTAKRLGIRTVAVFSEADRHALHVDMADEAVLIGPPPVAQSYLSIERLVTACKETGAEAVHPGYGFLSERASFARALTQEGIVFIGPNAEAIDAMGDKIRSKMIAAKAGVSTIPGHLAALEGPEEAVAVAQDIGLPVMIKASAGGGGKGMRIAFTMEEVREGFVRARSEAASSFGDDRVFIERFIQNPRHIEIQVLGDKHGTLLSLGERECSIQRRNQKVMEEAPSPFVDADMRARMGAQAVALARAVGYDSAGTVEFVAGEDRSFYFLEMNTRLQVEHPVTECVTGIDLVEQMIRIAAGEKLSFRAADLSLNGWAIESRLYAEDPSRGFLPSTGRLTVYRPPSSLDTQAAALRIDTGVREGSDISVFYDPMIAKIITHAATREEAIEAQSAALDAFVVEGIATNHPFLSALMQHPRWRAGKLSTGFIAEEYGGGFSPSALDASAGTLLGIVALTAHAIEERRHAQTPGHFPLMRPSLPQDWVVRLGRMHVPFTLTAADEGFTLWHDGEKIDVSTSWRPGEKLWRGTLDGEKITVGIARAPAGYFLSWRGRACHARAMRPAIAALDALMPEKLPPDLSKFLLCPMPGLLVSLFVEAGQSVQAGDALAVVEAMKMENILRAERDGVVAKIAANPGDTLAVDAVILEFA